MADQGLAEKEPWKRQLSRYKLNIPYTLTTEKGEFQVYIIYIRRGGFLVF